MDNIVCDRYSVSKINFEDVYLKKIIHFSSFRQLEIALAIPASNEWKIKAINAAGEGLNDH